MDVAEVGFQPLAGVVGQRDEGLAVVAAVLADVAADLVVAARVGVLVAQTAEDLHGGVPLLGRGVLIGGEDGVDDGVKRAQHGRRRRLGAGVRAWVAAWASTSRTFRREWPKVRAISRMLMPSRCATRILA